MTFAKLALGLVLLSVLGPPVLTTAGLLVLLACCLALTFGDLRLSRGAAVAGVFLLLAALGVRWVPVPQIEEGHNIFLADGGGSDRAVRDALPPEVYETWLNEFSQRFPPPSDPQAYWRYVEIPSAYARSSDALWDGARYSRRVSTIGFDSLSSFRGGFANDILYGFVGGDAMSRTRGFRADLPYFVMYDLPPALDGSTLRWRGTVWWPEDGHYVPVRGQDASRRITAAGGPTRIYALHVPDAVPDRPWETRRETEAAGLAIRLEPSTPVRVALAVRTLLPLLVVPALTLVMVRVRWREYLAALAITAVALTATAMLIRISAGKYLGHDYAPQGAGDDGLTHDSLGRDMAAHLMGGDAWQAFRGGQDVYWDTPGMRYARMTEKVLFGDTNLGYFAIVGLLPLLVWRLFRQLTGVWWAMAGTWFFLLSPFGSLSFIQYVQNAKLGYAETMAFAMFVGGVSLLCSAQRPDGSGSRSIAFVGGACLAASMFLRPNMAFAVVTAAGLWGLAAWFHGARPMVIAGYAGLGCALWMPLHNLLYGHRFVLISDSAGSLVLTLGPTTYVKALIEFLLGGTHARDAATVSTQIRDWLFAEPRLPVASLEPLRGPLLVLRLASLAVTIWIAATARCWHPRLWAMALVALATHLPILFIAGAAQFRYSMTAWDFSAMVLIAAVAGWLTTPLRARRTMRPKEPDTILHVVPGYD